MPAKVEIRPTKVYLFIACKVENIPQTRHSLRKSIIGSQGFTPFPEWEQSPTLCINYAFNSDVAAGIKILDEGVSSR